MDALLGMDGHWKKVIQVSTLKHDIKVQYLHDSWAEVRQFSGSTISGWVTLHLFEQE